MPIIGSVNPGIAEHKVTQLQVTLDSKLRVMYRDIFGVDHEIEIAPGGGDMFKAVYDPIGDGSLQGKELRLIPKASSVGAEGTVFYDSDDDHVWVATE